VTTSLVLEGVALPIDLRVGRRWNSCRFDRRGDWDDPTSENRPVRHEKREGGREGERGEKGGRERKITYDR
jgi:hypothetical protein